MPYIVLTPEQSRVVEEATASIEVRMPHGEVVARILTPEEVKIVAESKRRLAAGGRMYPGKDVEARLAKLQALSEREELDEAKVKDLMRRMRAGEEV